MKRILQDFEAEALPVNIIHLEGRANAKIRSFIDLAVARLRLIPTSTSRFSFTFIAIGLRFISQDNENIKSLTVPIIVDLSIQTVFS